MEHKLIPLVCLAICAFVSGCASVAVTDDAIKRNTAHALGVSTEGVAISNRADEGIKSTYTAQTANGKKYSCYVTGTVTYTGRIVSDAMCNEMVTAGSGSGAPSSCNALLKAAGKCK